MKVFKSGFVLALLFCSTIHGIYANHVANGGFEEGTSNWNNLAYNGGSATYSIKSDGPPEAANYLEANVASLGVNKWEVQSLQSNLAVPLGVGNQYTLSFYAKANTTDNLIHVIFQEGAVWQPVLKRAVTTEWTKYTVHFIADAANPDFKIQYEKIGVYAIDGISITDWTGINEVVDVHLNPNNSFQEMEGFGGAITWFIYKLNNSPDRDFLLDKFVNDVGIDLLRVKNWYYPIDYPLDKSTETMVNWNENVSFKPTIEIVNDVKTLNPDIKVLLSSWGPPKALKSNNNPSRGTLSQTSGEFDYGKLADYYNTMLDSVGFNPDWISFQNEPGYEDTWRTCKWRPTEVDGFPGLDKALDSIYDRIKDRPYLPKILAPEVENIGNAGWSSLGTTFRAFTDPLKSKPYIDYYAFHNYNFNSVSSINNNYFFNIIRDEFTEHPSIMTEYSGSNHSWLDAAVLVQNTIIEANSSGYIWWSLIWDSGSKAMVKFDGDLNWVYGKEYHMMKHFAKYVDGGYKRVELSGNNETYKGSAYINPLEDEITLVLVNNNNEQEVSFSLAEEWDIVSETSFQSTNSSNFNPIITDIENGIVLPDSSITTLVLSVDKIVSNSSEIKEDAFKVFPNPTHGIVNLSHKVNFEVLSVLGEVVMSGNNNFIDITNLANGTYFVRVNNNNYAIRKISK